MTSSANTYPNKPFSQNSTHTYTQTASHQLALQRTLAFALTITGKRGLNVTKSHFALEMKHTWTKLTQSGSIIFWCAVMVQHELIDSHVFFVLFWGLFVFCHLCFTVKVLRSKGERVRNRGT